MYSGSEGFGEDLRKAFRISFEGKIDVPVFLIETVVDDSLSDRKTRKGYFDIAQSDVFQDFWIDQISDTQRIMQST